MPFSLTKRSDQGTPLSESQIDENWTDLEDEVDLLNSSLTTLATAVNSTLQSDYSPLASPALTGTPTAPTPAASDNSTKIATTAFARSLFFNRSILNAQLDGDLEVAHTSGNSINITTSVGNGNDSHLNFRKGYGGTPEDPQAIADGVDASLGTIAWYGYDGTNYLEAARIRLASVGDAVEGLRETQIIYDVKQSGNHTFRVDNSTKAFLDGDTGAFNFSVSPIAPTPAAGDLSTKLATTEFVKAQNYAPLASPALTGTPTAPTQTVGSNNTRVATTEFVKSQAYAPLASPALTGNPTAPTQASSTNNTRVATTAFVKAQLVSPVFTGNPTAPTAATSANSTQVATTAFVKAQFNSPLFTGTPLAPTASTATNNTQLATTAFVHSHKPNQLATSRTFWGQAFNGSANISGNLGNVGSITGAGQVVLTAANNTSLFLRAPGTGSVVVEAQGTGTVQLRAPAGQIRFYNGATTYYTAFNNESLTAPRSLIMANGTVTLTPGTMVPTTGAGASGTWSITATNCARSVLAGNGLSGGGLINADRTLTLGTPGNITNTSTNSVTATSHTHAVNGSALVSSARDVVGAYQICRNSSGGTISSNATVAGSVLNPSNGLDGGDWIAVSPSPPGTWRLMSSGSLPNNRHALFQRTA